ALRHILVPTNFSDASQAAVKYGVTLARAFGAKLHVLHVEARHDLEIMVERVLAVERNLGPEGHVGGAPHVNPAQELLRNVLTEQEQEETGAEYVLRASGRTGADVEILRYAKERGIDLIVMGTHGASSVAHRLLGSVTEDVVRRAACPV